MKTYNILSSGTSATAGINPLRAMRRHTLALLMAAAAGTAFTACTGDELATSTDEAALDPNTPVGITATLGAYGNSADSRALASHSFATRSFDTRSGELTNEDLAAMAAEDEFTSISDLPKYSLLYLYNYMGGDGTAESVTNYFKIKGTLGNMTFVDKDGADRTAPFYLKDFNVKEANKAAILILQKNIDFVIAAADRTVDADGAPGYAFTLKHTGAKVSVRLQDKDGKVIASDALATNGMMIVYPQGAFSGTDFDKVTKASDYTYKVEKLGDYTNQQDIKPITEHEGYYNVVIQASVGTGTGEAEGTTPTAYTADHKLTVSLAADAEAGKPAGTYSLPLSSVKLTGLAAGDSRANTTADGGDGTWTYTRPGEHIFVTLTVDQNQVMSATASIGNWNDATASAEVGKPGTDLAAVPSIELNGTGANGEPLYEIYDARGLQIFADIVNGVGCDGSTVTMAAGGSFTMPTTRNGSVNAKLMADIDLSGICGKVDGTTANDISWTPIGDYTEPEYATFYGTFDGQGHSVKNLYINSDKYYQGLFGYTKGSTIKDLTVENANVNTTGYSAGAIIGNIYSSTVTGCTVTGNTQVSANANAGGIIGTMRDGSTVTDCHVTGNTQVSANANAGGIIGTMRYGTLANSSSTASVKGTGEMTNKIGGIVGYWEDVTSSGSTITGCVSTGAVSGKYYVGGLVGCVKSADYKMTACYATGDVSGTYYIGGLLGLCWDNVNIVGCYYSGELGDGGSYRGALVGWNYGTGLVLTNCAAFSSVGDIGSTGSGIGSGNAAAEGSDNNLTGAGTYSAIYEKVNATKQADGSSYWKTATTTGLKLYWEE